MSLGALGRMVGKASFASCGQLRMISTTSPIKVAKVCSITVTQVEIANRTCLVDVSVGSFDKS